LINAAFANVDKHGFCIFVAPLGPVGADAVVIKLEEWAILGRLDESVVMASVHVTAVDKYTMKTVDVWLRAIGCLGQIW
ncbi:hypothetical protein KCU85_g9, partial [Aureobasidium melanogenum]